MKKTVLLLLLSLATALPSQANLLIPFSYNGLNYCYDETLDKCYVYRNSNVSGEINIASSAGYTWIDENGNTHHEKFAVTEIGENAFSGCTGLTSVTIPNSVTVIGENAFSGCTGLTSVTIPNSVTVIGNGAFMTCKSLTNISLPDSLKTIGYYVFSECTELTSITIPEGITSIGNSTFYDCVSLTSITIPETVTSIGGSAFERCTGLTSITIPDAVTSIGSSTFVECINLKEVLIGKGCTTLGVNVFNGCANLKKIAYPDNLSSAYLKRFEASIAYPADKVEREDSIIWGTGKSGLYFVPMDTEGVFNMPSTVKTVAPYAFYGCDTLTAVTTPRIENWLAIKFGNATSNPLYYAKRLFVGGSLLTELIIPASTKRINAYAFYNCVDVRTVTMASGVESAGDEPFSGCSSLKRITFNTSTDYLLLNYDSQKSHLTYGNKAQIYIKNSGSGENPEQPDFPEFSQDATEITIPDGIQWIPNYAFTVIHH